MINVLAFVHLDQDEQSVRIYRSHILRVLIPLCFSLIFVVVPWFFLFDYRSWQWGIALLSVLIGGLMSWYALDVWSTALVIETSKRWIVASRERWGRVRVREWAHESLTEPSWESSKGSLFGSWVWRERGTENERAIRLGWIPKPKHVSQKLSKEARKRQQLLTKRIQAIRNEEDLGKLEALFDEKESS